MFQLDKIGYRVDVFKCKTDVTSCLAVKTGLKSIKPAFLDWLSHFFSQFTRFEVAFVKLRSIKNNAPLSKILVIYIQRIPLPDLSVYNAGLTQKQYNK